MAAFTTIAAGVGLAATATTTAMSFSQASSQKKAAERATREADQKMAEARARLEVNYADTLNVPDTDTTSYTISTSLVQIVVLLLRLTSPIQTHTSYATT